MGPRFSIVLPTHNRPGLCVEAIASVEKQTFTDWELIVVDDASSPPFAHSTPLVQFRIIRQPTPQGGAASKRLGTEAASGEFVAYLDDDDLLSPDYLARVARAFEQSPELDVLFVGVNWFGQKGAHSQMLHDQAMAGILSECRPSDAGAEVFIFEHNLLAALLRTVPMPFQRPVVRRTALARIGLHRANCLLWDCDWALRAALTSRCGLMGSGLYLQRDDGQGYHSRPGRQLAQLESALEISLHLMRHAPQDTAASQRALLRKGAAKNAMAIAYLHSRNGHPAKCLSLCVQALRLDQPLAALKMPLGALVRWVSLRLRRPSDAQ